MDIKKESWYFYRELAMPNYLSVSTNIQASQTYHISSQYLLELLGILQLSKDYYSRHNKNIITIAYTRVIYYPDFHGISTIGLAKLFVQIIYYTTWISSIIIIGFPVYFTGLIIIQASLIVIAILYYYSDCRWTHYLVRIFILNYLFALGDFGQFDYNNTT